MSVIEAEVEVDETDIPEREARPDRRRSRSTRCPARPSPGKVTEIGNSPIQATGTGGARQATNFKVTCTLDGEIPDVRPGLHLHRGNHHRDARQRVAVPIQATTVREMVLDDKGQHRARAGDPDRSGGAAGRRQAAELKPGQTRKELEGVFVVQDNKAVFVPVKTGIAGEKYFEVLSGLKEGDSVIVGPFSSVRELARRRRGQDRGGAARPRRRSTADARDCNVMNQFFEAAVIALGAIWANKLRSFLTVLGNIVAVTSIIAVVSLVQGMNALRHRRDRVRRRRRQLHDPADAGGPHARPTRSASATTRASRSRRRRRSGASATTSAPSPAQAQPRATCSYRQRDGRRRRRSRACRATTSTSRPSTPSADA